MRELRRDGILAPPCQVTWLMLTAELRGIRRGKQFVTTKVGPTAIRPPDVVDRDFTAAGRTSCGS